jgi:hypothetical protein
METRDLISFTPKAVIVIDQKKQFDLLYLPKNAKKYSPILYVLRDGPLTLKELEYKYNTIADEPKKKNTIYSYVQDLEKGGLVTKAGQRISPGHTFCELLYDRTATIFYPVLVTDEFFKSKEATAALEQTRNLLSLYLEQPAPNFNKLKDVVFKTYQHAQRSVGDIFSEHSEEVSEITADLTFLQLDKICGIFETLMAVLHFNDNSEELLSELKLGGKT